MTWGKATLRRGLEGTTVEILRDVARLIVDNCLHERYELMILRKNRLIGG